MAAGYYLAMKKKKTLAFERVSATEASRYGITVGRRVKDNDGSLWVIAQMDRVADADAYDTYLIPWSPLMPKASSDRPGRLLSFR